LFDSKRVRSHNAIGTEMPVILRGERMNAVCNLGAGIVQGNAIVCN